MVKNNFVPKSIEQARLYEELKTFIFSDSTTIVVTLKNQYSNKLIQTTLHQLGYKTKTRKFKDPITKKIKPFTIYKY